MTLTERPSPRRPARRARPLRDRVALLEVIPDLADTLPAQQVQVAERIGARVLSIRRGRWDAAADVVATGAGGFLVLSGTLLRRTQAGHREAAELLGAGDVAEREVEDGVDWRALEETLLVPLDRQLLSDCAHVPPLAGALTQAAVARANTLARQLVVAQWSAVDDRIVTVFGLLAERWGVMTAEGVVLPEWLTHSVIAPLVGARRPSVTTALKRLQATGAVTRRADGRWLLGGER